MQRHLLSILILSAAVGGAGCSTNKSPNGQKEQNVSLAQISEPARATVTRVTAGGQADRITREIERGKAVYDVEATVQGRHLEFLISEADGTVLGTEVPIAFNELPEPVQTAAEKYFGHATGLKVMKGIEYGETSYEVEGAKNGRTVEVTFDPLGKRQP